uniref:Uncharacterized protein n=1 Tax=viral metagenome TaxID=1070528 RepID=A0A6M3LJV1_9ZZZZ
MLLFSGKAKDMTYKMLLWSAYMNKARYMEALDVADFCLN